MEAVRAWDLDGTIRPGSLLGDAVLHAADVGFIDVAEYVDPSRPTYLEADNFLRSVTARSRKDFLELTDRLTDEARVTAYPWALDRLASQSNDGAILVLSHSPAFLVKAFCRGLNITRANGTYFHTKQLVFSGRATLLDKHASLNRHLRNLGASELSFAAGDTVADLPLLRRARHAAVVNPNDALYSLAETNNWEVIRTE